MVAALLKELSRARGEADDDAAFQLQYAIVNSLEIVTGRHLFETTLQRVADAVGVESFTPRCENLAQLTHKLARLLKYPPQPARRHFVLVFDSIDRQREAPPTLLPALARLSEIVGLPPPPPPPPQAQTGSQSLRYLTRPPDPVHDNHLHPAKSTT